MIKALKQDRKEDPISRKLYQLMALHNISAQDLSRKSKIPQATLQKILSGTTDDPRASTLKALADAFDISVGDLFTQGETLPKAKVNINVKSLPIISWADSIDYEKVISEINEIVWDRWIACEDVSDSAFALISKASMEPKFPKGSILIIDPKVEPVDGDIVVVVFPKTDEATIRRLQKDGPSKYLLPINGTSEPEILSVNIKIKGVLIKSLFTFHE